MSTITSFLALLALYFIPSAHAQGGVPVGGPAVPPGGAAPGPVGVGGVGVGGAAGVPAMAPTQYPLVVEVPKLVTLPGGAVTSTQTMFTQTFATGPLETWVFAKPSSGSIGLGDLEEKTPKTAR